MINYMVFSIIQASKLINRVIMDHQLLIKFGQLQIKQLKKSNMEQRNQQINIKFCNNPLPGKQDLQAFFLPIHLQLIILIILQTNFNKADKFKSEKQSTLLYIQKNYDQQIPMYNQFLIPFALIIQQPQFVNISVAFFQQSDTDCILIQSLSCFLILHYNSYKGQRGFKSQLKMSNFLFEFIQQKKKQLQYYIKTICLIISNPIEMSSLNILSIIGMTFFWIKFYIFIGLKYAYNFVKYSLQKMIDGNSKTVICPYKNTHQDVFLQLEQLIKLDGYSIDNYQFQTPDHAFVSFWRVRSTDPNAKQQKYPVMILHGLLDCSVSWFLQKDKTKCLPYMLASQGYDVWVGNNRGTKHSLRNSNRLNYWQYCFDHFVQYDQPTMINSILQQTGKEKLIYIGHSQGSTQFLVSTGVHNFNDKIACFVGMGTVISLEHLNNHVILKYLTLFKGVQILKFFGFKTVLSLPKWATRATGILIYNTQFYFNVFSGIVTLLCGKNVVNKIDKQRLGVIISHEPGGTSIPNVQQWIQFYKTGKLAKFDYGKRKNIEIYGSQNPTQYSFNHLKELKFKSYIFKGQADAVISEKDYQKLKNLMHKDKFVTIQLDDYAHLDYVWGTSASQDIYTKILQIFHKQQLQTLD